MSRRLLIISLALLYLLLTVVVGRSKEKVISGVAEVNGTRLYYETAGKGSTVVLVHGGLVDSRLWDDQFSEFARRHHVIRYDLRGFGRSAYGAEAFSHVEDLYELLKFLKVERASFVGLSLGGMISMDFALEHPLMVERLVLTSSGLRGSTAPRNEKSRAVFKVAETEGRDKAIDMWMGNEFFSTGRSNNPAYEERTRAMLRDNYKTWGPTPKPLVWNWPTKLTIERLGEIKVPTLIIIGDRDAPTILINAQLIESRITGAKKVVMKGVSHHLNMEKPAEYNRIVLGFLKKK